MIDFVGFPKIARYSRKVIVTEKIDGTNAQIYIPEPGSELTIESSGAETFPRTVVPFLVGSRTRWITPSADNHGFAAWAYAHADELLQLGPGHHFGEWWGKGINRNYGRPEKRFSLFNVGRWHDWGIRPRCCDVVPILWQGPIDILPLDCIISDLRILGSVAAPGYMKPEGIVIFHVAGNHLYKKTLEKDEQPKGAANAA